MLICQAYYENLGIKNLDTYRLIFVHLIKALYLMCERLSYKCDKSHLFILNNAYISNIRLIGIYTRLNQSCLECL